MLCSLHCCQLEGLLVRDLCVRDCFVTSWRPALACWPVLARRRPASGPPVPSWGAASQQCELGGRPSVEEMFACVLGGPPIPLFHANFGLWGFYTAVMLC